ncbi:glycosyltransferase family 4 protein [Frondihabitans sp. Leaf304]|uniref:glycosyltransferase family 4 protein n=1 Tax=Frondihabitans sp. Leaf304 TaxID=1736329 RepID=UPI0009FDAE7F|nr:glycosyltransferase family 4 protein [Frondihabitans sp. Leaf304]
MRVLLLTSNYVDRSRGGVELHVYNLAKGLISSGHDVVVGRTSGGEALHEVDGPEVRVLGRERRSQGAISDNKSPIPFVRLARNFLERLQIGRQVGRRLRQELSSEVAFDVIHHHDFITSFFIAREIHGLGVRQVWTNHLGEFLILARIPLVGRFVTRRLTRFFTAATGPSLDLADQRAVSCPIMYVPNGVDVSLFKPLVLSDRDVARAQRGWSDHDLVTVIPRRWAPSKGVLFAALAMSTDSWPDDVVSVFVGSGESDVPEYAQAVRSALAQTAAPFEVIDSVTPSAMAEILRLADVCIIPSLLEATSLSALEAMASGLPVVATNIGGLPDLIEPGVNGWLIEPQNASQIAAAVKAARVMSTEDRMSLGLAGREKVLRDFAWDGIVIKLVEMYGSKG